MVYFEMNADNLRFVTNKSPGKIESVSVCQYGGVTCGGFEAMTQQGYLKAKVQNTGSLAALYHVSVVDCTPGIMAMPDQTHAIDAGATFEFSFVIYMTTDVANAGNACDVILKDDFGNTLDMKTTSFYTTATQYTNSTDFSARPGQSVQVVGGGGKTCKQKCPGLFDIFCVLRTGCWRNLFTTLITIAFVVLFLVAVVFMVRKGWCIMLMPVKGRKGKGKKSKARDPSPTPTPDPHPTAPPAPAKPDRDQNWNLTSTLAWMMGRNAPASSGQPKPHLPPHPPHHARPTSAPRSHAASHRARPGGGKGHGAGGNRPRDRRASRYDQEDPWGSDGGGYDNNDDNFRDNYGDCEGVDEVTVDMGDGYGSEGGRNGRDRRGGGRRGEGTGTGTNTGVALTRTAFLALMRSVGQSGGGDAGNTRGDRADRSGGGRHGPGGGRAVTRGRRGGTARTAYLTGREELPHSRWSAGDSV